MAVAGTSFGSRLARAGDGRRRPAPERRARRARGVRAHVAPLPADLARLDLRLVRAAGAVPRRDGDRARRLRGRVGQRGDGRRAVHRVPRARRCSCRPSCRARAFEGTFPIIGGFHWNRRYHAMFATPLTPDAIAFGQIAWTATRSTIVGSIFCFVIILFGAAGSPRDPVVDPDRDAHRPRVRGADRGLHDDPARRHRVQLDLAVRDHAAVPVLGHVLPDRPAAEAIRWIAWLSRCGTGSPSRAARASGRCRRGAAHLPRPPGDPHRVRGRSGCSVDVPACSAGSWPRERLRRAPARAADPARQPAGDAAHRAQPVRLQERLDRHLQRASSSRCSTCSRWGSASAASSATSRARTACRSRTRCSSRRRCSPRRR